MKFIHKLCLSQLFVLIFCFFVFKPTYAYEYFVSNSGNDSNSGSSTSPFLTITKGVSVLSPGDILNIQKGNYSPFVISKSGTKLSPIVIKGNWSVISGGQNAINVTGSYLDLSGFEVKDSVSHGIVLSGKNINFSDFSVHDTVNENKSGSSCTGSGGWGSGFKIYVGGENINIQNGQIYHNCGEGLAVTRGINVNISKVVSYDNFSANIYIDNSRDVTLEKSFIYCTSNTNYYRSSQPAVGILIGEENYSGWGAQLENIKIYNNIQYSCRGLNFYGAEVSSGGLVGALIVHNTIWGVYNNGRSISIASEPNNSNIVIKNNIAAGSITTGSGIVVANNISNTKFASTVGFTPESFKLATNSDSIDAGTQVGISDDFEGNARDSFPDLGAFEYKSLLPTTKPYLRADINRDGVVDMSDYDIFLLDFGRVGYINSDIDVNGKVDIFDYAILVTDYGKNI